MGALKLEPSVTGSAALSGLPAPAVMAAEAPAPSLAVVVPATDQPPTLERCLAALRRGLGPGDELIVVTEPVNGGPAASRNIGALGARAEVLVFVDSDVIVHADALARLRAAFAAEPHLSAVFGSYDASPEDPGLVSQFRNLLHHHVHHQHAGPAATFWSGLGAVRRSEFVALGGFDTRFQVAAVEDIDLGMRLRERGGRIELRPEVQGTHLKHWTLSSMIRTDFTRRGVPWTVMCLERRSLPRTLNLSLTEQASSLAMLLGLGGALSGRARLRNAGVTGLVALNAPFYRLLLRCMGLRGAAGGIALHALHRLIGVAAVQTGLALYLTRRSSRRLDERGR